MADPSRKSLTESSLKSGSSPQQGNLTGPRRVVNDNAVTFFNSVQKWNDMYVNGSKIFQDLLNTNDDNVFQKSCEKLGIIVETMKQQTTAMTNSFKKFTSLSQLQPSSSCVYSSWTHKDFGNEIHH